MKRSNFMGLMFALFIVLVFSSSAFAIKLKLLAAYQPNFIFNVGITDVFKKNLVEISGGQIEIQQFGPDVVPTFEQFQPTQAGVFDINFTHPTYHAGNFGLGILMDITKFDPTKRRETGLFDYMDKAYNKVGIKLLALPPVSPYHYITKEPLSGEKPSFKGLKLRSNPTLQNVVIKLGGSPVTMSGGNVYTSLQKGVIDGAAWTLVGVKDFKWYEVAKYMVRPTFGSITMMIMMNLDKYNSLSADERKWLDEAGKKTELDSLAFFNGKIDSEIKFLEDKGMKYTQMNADDAKMVNVYFNDGIVEMAQKLVGDKALEFKKLAEQKGMLQ